MKNKIILAAICLIVLSLSYGIAYQKTTNVTNNNEEEIRYLFSSLRGMAPFFLGIIFSLILIFKRIYKKLANYIERSNVVKKITTSEKCIKHEYLYVFLFLIILVIISFSNVIFSGHTIITSSMCEGTLPTGPYGYNGPSMPTLKRPVIDAGASAWQNEPWAAKIHQEFLDKRVPLWNPNSGVGVPLLANMQSAPFSPFRIFFYISTSPIVWDFYFLLRLLSAGFFTYLFLRTINRSLIGSITAAISFMFCGYLIENLNMGHLDVDVLVPAVILAFELLFRDWRPRNLVFSSMLVCFSILGGMPESTFFVLLLAFLYYFFRVIWCESKETPKTTNYYMRHLFKFSLAIFLGILLSGPQLFPFLEYLQNSWTRHGGTLGLGSNPIRGGISLIIPYFCGGIQFNWNDISSFSLVPYIGVITLFLAFIGVFSRHSSRENKIKYFFLSFALFSILKIYGFFLINWIGHLPLFNRLIFEKYCIPEFSFSIAVLSGIGIDYLLQNRISRNRIRLALGLFLLLGIILIYIGVRPFDPLSRIKEIRIIKYVFFHLAFAILAIIVGYVLIASTQRGNRKILPVFCIMMLLFGELFYYIPKSRAIRYDPATVPPFVNYLKQDQERFRVLGINSILYPNSSSFYDIDCITDLDAMYPSRYMDFIKSCLSPEIYDRFIGQGVASNLDKIGRYLSLMNVKYILSSTHLDSNKLISDILDKSVIIPKEHLGISRANFTINGKPKGVLFQHPPSTILYPVIIPPEAKLSFSIALSTDCWYPSMGDGVRFIVKVQENGSINQIFSKTIDPKNNPKDRRWFDCSVDLSNYKDKNVFLILETDPLYGTAYDWAGWGDIMLFNKPTEEIYSPVYDSEIKIFRNNQVFPRTFVVPKATFLKDEKEVLLNLKNPQIDLKNVVLLEEKQDTMDYRYLNLKDVDWWGNADVVEYNSNQVIIKANVPKGGFLVLTDLYYPGWKAYVDGKRQKILQADYIFRSLNLQPGDHLVKFIYDPLSFKLGCLSTFFSVLALGLFFITFKRHDKQGGIRNKKEKDDLEKVISTWGSDESTCKRYGKGFHWVESRTVLAHINTVISGNATVGFLDYFCDKYLKKGAGGYTGLSLGCGTGELERQLQRRNMFKRLEAVDVTQEAILQAERSAKAEHLDIEYRLANLNKMNLKESVYDVVFANSILHHLKNLEHIIDQVRISLVKGGLFFVNEYVGPPQFQYTTRQVRLINEILNLLPEMYRKRVTNPKLQKPLFVPPSREYMDQHDPSEAIRSDEIVSLLKKRFTVLEHKDYGGTILHMLLQDIVGNFDPEDPKDITVLKLLIYFEEYLVKAGILSSDFTFMVLKKDKT